MAIIKSRPALVMIRFITICILPFLFYSTRASDLSSTVERTNRNQLISSLPSSNYRDSSGTSQQFIVSPSGRYEGLFVRRTTADTQSGSYSRDYCYIQIVGSGHTLWESECAPVSAMDTCSLVFSDFGLEIYDGGRSVWDTNADGVRLQAIRMLDNGDLQIRDQGDQVAWKASDDQKNSHNCGSMASPAFTSSYSPYASPLPDLTVPPNDPQPAFNQPYNQQQPPSNYRPLNQPYSSVNQPYSSMDQPYSSINTQPFSNGVPLIHNPLFGSGSTIAVPCSLLFELGLFMFVLGACGLLP